MKKITIEKSDDIAEVIDQIIAAHDTDITLIIPKGSILAKSGSNFRLLKREADAADKIVVIESVDETILAFAKEHRIQNTHSFLKNSRNAGPVSDIIVREDSESSEEDDDRNVKMTLKTTKSSSAKITNISSNDDEDGDDEELATESIKEEEKSDADANSFFNRNRFFKERVASSEDDEDDSRKSSGKGFIWMVVIIAILAIAFYGVTIAFGRATVTIDFTQTPWSYQGNFIADKSATSIDPTTNTLPAQILSSQKNITELFPATGQSGANSAKAKGTITIYNDYSAASQELVTTTRFVTPDGKIFRLVGNVTVPGATVSNGTVSPNSITATVVADQPGAAYNIGPVAKLTIPGFQGTPEYTGFYGALLGQTSGGFVGTSSVVTATDIANAKASTTAILESDLQNDLATSYQNNFKILDGATSVQINKLTVNTTTDQNGNFSVFGEATLSAIGFDQTAFETYLLSLAQSTEASSSFKTIAPVYSNVQADFTKGQISFLVSAQGTLEPTFSSTDFASSIAGKSIADARSTISALPQLSSGKISVWPLWLWNIPSNSQRVQVIVN
jgi:hypothetical protein